MKILISVLAAGVLLAGCGTPGNTPMYQPVIDPNTVSNMGLYHHDLGECTQLAKSAGGPNAFSGLLGGLLVGAAYGGIAGDTGYGARLGGLTGMLAGGAGDISQERHITNNCMRGRGYKVLN